MRDFDSEIDKVEIKIEENKAELATVYEEFMNGTVEFFKEWYLEEAKRIVVNNPEIAVKLGEEKLRILKGEVNELAGDTHKIVHEKLEIDGIWWHKVENELDYVTYSLNLPDFLQTKFEIIAGRLGIIFEKHEFFTIPLENMRNNTSDYVRSNQNVKFVRHFGVSKSLMDTYKKYSKQIEKVKLLKYELQSIISEKKKFNVGDIWDSL